MYSPLHQITLDGLQIGYRVQGRGPDVLLLHGWVSSGRMWQTMMDALESRFRLWAPDLPGFGDSEKPEHSWYSIANYNRFVRQFMARLALEQVDVIGHSMGGMLAFDLAIEHPEQVRRLAAINPVVTGRTHLDLRLLSESSFGQQMLKLGRWVWPLATSDWPDWAWLGVDRKRAIYARRIREDWGKATSDSAMSSLRAIARNDLTPRLTQVKAPTLVVVGNRDLTAPNSEGRLAAHSVPGARLVVLPTGHLPTDDLPDRTQTLVEEFLGVREFA
ncbi:MAG: alpha/beta hydrolase [Chloroflexi bacterium]|nr:alpha/beta hydrolase [Chloroflexota bacterium]